MRYAYEGSVIETSTAAELVAKLHERSEAPAATDAIWMGEVSHRMELQFGKPLETGSPEAFVEGLVGLGLLKPEE